MKEATEVEGTYAKWIDVKLVVVSSNYNEDNVVANRKKRES